MLNWSNTKYKFTFGVGGLAETAVMAELWKPVLPFWAVMVVALLPLAVFVFVHPDEMPAGLVRAAHVFASAWYVVSAVALSVGISRAPKPPDAGIVLLCAAGLVPAVFVLSQAVRGRYRLPDEHRGGDSAAG